MPILDDVANATPELVEIPAGSFWMGADVATDKFASALELPRHEVRIDRPFQIGKYPVTFNQWDAFFQQNPHIHRPDDRGFGRGQLPVFGVSWTDAMQYVDWLSQVMGQPYRLPSETEWEYCCRAGSGGIFATGDRLSVDDANYLYTDFRERPGLGRPVSVGSYPPNAFGLFDMHGNVCEFVADPWRDDYAHEPIDGTPLRVVRNGGWDAMPRILRCAFRDWVDKDQRLDNVGIRIARSLPPSRYATERAG
jgi:formylglycine-generating enzyme required for sulfatase activity